MADLSEYTVVTKPDDNRTFVAYVPAIPGCHAVGRTPEEARTELANVFSMIAEEYAEEGRVLPPDVRASDNWLFPPHLSAAVSALVLNR